MNPLILQPSVQDYINENQQADVNKIALAKPIFDGISSAELAGQISAKKKSKSKLPTWYKQENIYYPVLLSIEQCSSEQTAAYKANLAKGKSLIDLTAGFGVDSFFFAKKCQIVFSCEINEELATVTTHNAETLNAKNITILAENGIDFLKNTDLNFETIYIDPARRSESAKVFKLKDCTPDVTIHIDEWLLKSSRIIIKTAPLLDITAGLNELKNVSQIHIVSVKNECKELLWVIDRKVTAETEIVCATINQTIKTLSFSISALQSSTQILKSIPKGYLYEPDVALLKSGAFNYIAEKFNLQKLHQHSQLYFSDVFKADFLGRIFEIEKSCTVSELKKMNSLSGNVIVRNFPEKAENLVKKYKIIPHDTKFIIFTKTNDGNLVLFGNIKQHY
ncbi:MAG: hypothetical protein EOO47_08110 [Flavobacterium sp.]|nr:MAG: hypothetical protein EOO47_08110 [Flavobacterium sp.]